VEESGARFPRKTSRRASFESANGETQGTGFVVADRLVVTCALVIELCGAEPGDHAAFRANFYRSDDPHIHELDGGGTRQPRFLTFLPA
jgi:hypothetical protein